MFLINVIDVTISFPLQPDVIYYPRLAVSEFFKLATI
jgi:hypothetical protein